MTEPRFSQKEFAERADVIYEHEVEPRLASDDVGKFVAIDIESGAHEIAPDELSASDRLLARHPGAQIWLRRIGSRYTHRFGPRARSVGT